MMTRMLLSSTTLLATLLAAGAGCTASDPTDELAGESATDGDAGKADAPGAFTYFTVTPDRRACSLNSRCGGYFVARANRSTTTCADGTAAARCYVDAVELTKLAMPKSVADGYQARLRAGEGFLVRGDLAKRATGAALAATELWVPAVADAAPSGVFIIAQDSGIRCITAPCPSVRETRLNSTRTANIDALDLEASGADADTVDRGGAAVYGDGVIVAGDRFYQNGGGKGRSASQFYTRAPIPQH
jgi:hypothetical protein